MQRGSLFYIEEPVSSKIETSNIQLSNIPRHRGPKLKAERIFQLQGSYYESHLTNKLGGLDRVCQQRMRKVCNSQDQLRCELKRSLVTGSDHLPPMNESSRHKVLVDVPTTPYHLKKRNGFRVRKASNPTIVSKSLANARNILNQQRKSSSQDLEGMDLFCESDDSLQNVSSPLPMISSMEVRSPERISPKKLEVKTPQGISPDMKQSKRALLTKAKEDQTNLHRKMSEFFESLKNVNSPDEFGDETDMVRIFKFLTLTESAEENAVTSVDDESSTVIESQILEAIKKQTIRARWTYAIERVKQQLVNPLPADDQKEKIIFGEQVKEKSKLTSKSMERNTPITSPSPNFSKEGGSNRLRRTSTMPANLRERAHRKTPAVRLQRIVDEAMQRRTRYELMQLEALQRAIQRQ